MKHHSLNLIWHIQPMLVACLFSFRHSDVQAQDLPPSFTTQPSPVAVCQGGSALFSVIVSGTAPITFQWRFNQIDLEGATRNVLNVSNVTFAQAGDYQLVAANSAGSVTSVVARLSVGPSLVKLTS